jgi:hypothetical protein
MRCKRLVSLFWIQALGLALAREVAAGSLRSDARGQAAAPASVAERIVTNADEDLRIRIARVWEEGKQTHVAVSVRNAGTYEFRDIDLGCTAYDADARTLGRKQARVTADRYGRLLPGFSANLELAFAAPQRVVRSLSCDARADGVPRRTD